MPASVFDFGAILTSKAVWLRNVGTLRTSLNDIISSSEVSLDAPAGIFNDHGEPTSDRSVPI